MTYFELVTFIRNYQSYIYTGDKLADLALLEEEVSELYRLGIIDTNFYKEARLILLEEKKTKQRRDVN
ncbi:YqgQ family protein [Salipaludibacillus agaradhaerens]|uniref:YqgQ family protein n=1 Tax=Salipaludibacillus agaradhaerens TaxID=76935 RepID=UPI00099761F7|nr:YqgQ family protein [Salipaludibacillus agaradhaerens]